MLRNILLLKNVLAFGAIVRLFLIFAKTKGRFFREISGLPRIRFPQRPLVCTIARLPCTIGWRFSTIARLPYTIGWRFSTIAWLPCTIGWWFCTIARLPCTIGWRFSTIARLPYTIGWRFSTIAWLPCTIGWWFCTIARLLCTIGWRFCTFVPAVYTLPPVDYTFAPALSKMGAALYATSAQRVPFYLLLLASLPSGLFIEEQNQSVKLMDTE